MFRRIWVKFLRFVFHQFYNPFAFTYDFVSAIVSRGRWRAWTRAAIPRIVGTRVLELACGTGNLLLDLSAAGYAPIGIDLSPTMIRIARGKIQKARTNASLARAHAQTLPFCNRAFDSIVMTFPPGFVYDPRVLAEIHRLLADDGRLIWVDAGRLLQRDLPNRLIDRAFKLTGNSQSFTHSAIELLTSTGFQTNVETVQEDASSMMVTVATKHFG